MRGELLLDCLGKLPGLANDALKRASHLSRVFRWNHGEVSRAEPLQRAVVQHGERLLGGAGDAAWIGVRPYRNRGRLIGEHEELMFRDVEDNAALGVSARAQHIDFGRSVAQAPSAPLRAANLDRTGSGDIFEKGYRLQRWKHVRVGRHQYIDHDRRHEFIQSWQHARLPDLAAKLFKNCRTDRRRAERLEQAADLVRWQRQPVNITEVVLASAIHLI